MLKINKTNRMWRKVPQSIRSSKTNKITTMNNRQKIKTRLMTLICQCLKLKYVRNLWRRILTHCQQVPKILNKARTRIKLIKWSIRTILNKLNQPRKSKSKRSTFKNNKKNRSKILKSKLSRTKRLKKRTRLRTRSSLNHLPILSNSRSKKNNRLKSNSRSRKNSKLNNNSKNRRPMKKRLRKSQPSKKRIKSSNLTSFKKNKRKMK